MHAGREFRHRTQGKLGRLELAQWLARRDNPLTARVAVNRIWGAPVHGETGIVATVDNFGAMGEKPTNQALLDYLAVRFMDQGWSTTKMVREIVLSRAYRLSSATNERNENIDPGNVSCCGAPIAAASKWKPFATRCCSISGQLGSEASGRISRNGIPSRAQPGYGGKNVARNQRNAPDDYAVAMKCRTVYAGRRGVQLPAADMFETFDFP